jgi:hypothetical protein
MEIPATHLSRCTGQGTASPANYFQAGGQFRTRPATEPYPPSSHASTPNIIHLSIELRQAVFKRGKDFITRDSDGHNGGAWKMADSVKNVGSKETRTGTFDLTLNRIEIDMNTEPTAQAGWVVRGKTIRQLIKELPVL